MSSRGDELLAELCRERYATLTATAVMLTGSRHAAEDLLHDALVAVFSRPRRLANINAADAYVRRAMYTRFIDGTRSGKSRNRVATAYQAGQPTDYTQTHTDWASLEALLAGLAPRVRACIVLRFLEDMSVAETAHALALSEGAVKRYCADGLALLNRELGTQDVPDADPTVPVQRREVER